MGGVAFALQAEHGAAVSGTVLHALSLSDYLAKAGSYDALASTPHTLNHVLFIL